MRLAHVHSWARRVSAIPGLPAAALLAGMVFLFQPAQIYEGNSHYINFALVQMAAVLVPAFFASLAVLAAIAAIGGARSRSAMAVVFAALAAAAWGGATFLPEPKGVIDGRAVFSMTAAEQWRHTAGYIAFAAAGGFAAWLRPEMTRRLFATLFLVLAAHAVWVVARDSKPWPSSEAAERLATLSTERNVIVVILDTFQSDFFAEIRNRDTAISRAFEGFVYYPNAVGHAPTTYLSMPAIHSGGQFDASEGMAAIYQRKVVEGSFVASLASAGYDGMVVNPMLGKCPRGALCEEQETVVRGHGKALLEWSRYLVELALYRAAPAKLKAGLLRPEGRARMLVMGSDDLLSRLASNLEVGSTRPALRFIHLYNSHPPAVFDARCMEVKGVRWRRSTAVDQDHCVVTKVMAFLDKIRELGIYDRTAIIIAADHGAAMRHENDGDINWASLQDWGPSASPLLLAKPFGARGGLTDSPRVVGLSDIAATICAWTRDCTAQSGSDVTGPELPPAYPFAAYRWENRFWYESTVPIENRFEIRGPPMEIASWWRLTNLPVKPVPRLRFGTADAAEHYGMGWSGIEGGEDGARWSVGRESDLYIDLDPARDARIALQVLTHPGNPRQSMVVEVNGRKVGEFPVPAALSNPRFIVPAAHITDGVDRILFRFGEWNQPGNGDPRPLAVRFSGLRIEPADAAKAQARP